MAGDWIKIEKTTSRKPEVLEIAEILDIHPDHAFGLCVRFWSWCDDHIADGHARSVTEKRLDFALDVQGFATALVKVGWLQVRSGSLVIPHFERHLSQSAKNRALATERKNRQRKERSQSERDIGHGDSVTKAGPEKRREEKKSANADSPLPPRGEPALPHGPAFADAWREWLAHLKQKRCNPTPLAKDRQLRKLAAMSEADAVAMIDASIGGNYQGLYPPKDSGASQSRNGSRQAPRDLTRASDLLGETTIEP